METAFLTLLWVSAIGCGLMAGIYFAFSAFIMASLATLPSPQGIAAMQAINRVILGSPFMVLFFGTTLSSALLVVFGIVYWGEPTALMTVVAGDLYVFGMFLVTAAYNVPLNNALDAQDPNDEAAVVAWERYLRIWTRWNHVRTVASVISCGLFIDLIRTIAG